MKIIDERINIFYACEKYDVRRICEMIGAGRCTAGHIDKVGRAGNIKEPENCLLVSDFRRRNLYTLSEICRMLWGFELNIGIVQEQIKCWQELYVLVLKSGSVVWEGYLPSDDEKSCRRMIGDIRRLMSKNDAGGTHFY